MKKWSYDKLLLPLLVILSISVLFEIMRTGLATILFTIGVIGLLITYKLSKEPSMTTALTSAAMIVLALFQTASAWILAIVIVLIFIRRNQEVYNTVREALFQSRNRWNENEYVAVRFSEQEEIPIKKSRRRWFGEENSDSDIYEWEDINYSKIAGNTVIDLGNTIIPKKENIVLIRKGFGNVKILVPQEVGVSLDLSVLLGEVTIGQDALTLNNEVLKYQSSHYAKSSRKIKIITNTLFGKIEVIFL